jgi:large subunit ribosomal protein L5
MSTVPGDDRLEAETGDGAAAPSPKPEGAPKRTTRRKEGSGTGRRTRAAATQAAGATTSGGAATAVAEATEKPEMPRPRLLEEFKAQIVPAMVKEFEYGNVMQVPRLTKVVLNIGLGEALTNPRAIETAIQDLTTISGQKPVVTRARKSIAGFKLREGNPIGVTVTLRGVRMYHFMDRLLNMALPRIRDFRGVSPSSFDGRGNYSLGIREQIIFPEIDYGQIERIRGFQVTIGTTAKTDAEALRLLALMGMPFARQE